MKTSADETAPHSVEAEQQVIGAILSNNSLYEAHLSGFLEKEHFSDPIHAWIYQRCEDLLGEGRIASPVTLKRSFSQLPASQELGGPKYLLKLVANSISSTAVKDYAQLIIDQSVRRDLLAIIDEGKAEVTDDRSSVVDVSIRLENRLGEVNAKSSVKPLVISNVRAMTDGLNLISDAYRGETSDDVTLSGLTDLDDTLGGLRAGQMILIGGRPAMGKTTLAQNIAYNVAKAGGGVFFGSLEMYARELSIRFISRHLRSQNFKLTYKDMIDGKVSEPQMRYVVEAAKQLESMPMMFSERDTRTLPKFRASVRRAQRMFGDRVPFRLIVCDYVQLLQDSRYIQAKDRVDAASDMLKSLAMEFGVPVIALAQLNRSVELRDPPIPQLSDLRDSGSLEQDADAVLFTYRDEYYVNMKLASLDPHHDAEDYANYQTALANCSGKMDVIVAKQRSGPTPTVAIGADMATCFTHNLERAAEQRGMF